MDLHEFDRFAAPYINAEITTVYLQYDTPMQYLHIYSLVELIPESQAMSIELPTCSSDIKINKHTKLIIQRKHCTIAEAKRYYYSNTNIVLPVYERNVPIAELTPSPPSGCYVLSPQNGWETSPAAKILPLRHMGFRISMRMDTQKSFHTFASSLFSSESESLQFLNKVCRRIDEKLQIDISNHKEFLGSIVLAAQNPYLWTIKRINNKKNDPDWALMLMHRKNNSCDGLQFQFTRDDNMGTVFGATIIANGPIISIKLPYKMNTLNMKMWDKQGCLIEDSALPYFGSDIKNQAVYALENENKNERSFRQLERSGAFVYFHAGEQEKAKKSLKDIIAKTNNKLIICDPYLREDSLELLSDFAPSAHAIEILLFTSLRSFNKTENENQAALEHLLNDISNLSKSRSEINSIRCCILLGKAHNMGILHDRFIIRDSKYAWSLGSSINAFGSRDTMLIQLPEATIAPLNKRVETWVSDNRYAVNAQDYNGFCNNN